MQTAKLWKTFCAVVEHDGFQGAQDILALSQPAVSNHIAHLEELLGYRLCQRGRSGFHLTERGNQAYQKCRQMLNTIDDFESELMALRGVLKGTLRIGVVDTVLTHQSLPIQDTIRAFYDQDTDVTLEMTVASPKQLEVDLLNNAIHVAIAPFWNRRTGLSYISIGKERHHLYCADTHPLFHRPSRDILPEQLHQYPRSYRSYEHQTTKDQGRCHARRALVSNMEAQMLLLLSGHFVGTLPSHYAAQWEQQGRLRTLCPQKMVWFSNFYIVSRQGAIKRHAVSRFIDLFCQLIEKDPLDKDITLPNLT
ncbi:MAG: LysR family transcriptional regulator [Pseudomonadota bacterium]